jgi:hypothetical protein
MGTVNSSKINIKTIPSAATTLSKYRKDGIAYSKNELFLDVNEILNISVNSEGSIIENEISGNFIMTSKLSGMPQIKMGIIFPQKEIEDVHFHHCIKKDTLFEDNNISFIPPDGTFELLSYRQPSTNGVPL